MPKQRTIAFLLAAATILAASNAVVAETQPCRAMEYDRNAYTICEVDLLKHTLRLYWNRPDGTPYAYLSALPRSLEGETGRLLFATNAGMYDPALKPVGLYVEQGRELVHVNTRSGYGNFHMRPNGIFYVSGNRAAIEETRAFLKQRPQTDLATQSGPMLVINGRSPVPFSARPSKIEKILAGYCTLVPNSGIVNVFQSSAELTWACALVKARRITGRAVCAILWSGLYMSRIPKLYPFSL